MHLAKETYSSRYISNLFFRKKESEPIELYDEIVDTQCVDFFESQDDLNHLHVVDEVCLDQLADWNHTCYCIRILFIFVGFDHVKCLFYRANGDVLPGFQLL